MKAKNVVVGTKVQIKDDYLEYWGVMSGDTGVIDTADDSDTPCVHWTGSPIAHLDKKWWISRSRLRIVKDK